MKQWSHYNKSTILFNITHYMFILYLTWISNTFPDSKTLLIVDRSTTHFGPLITEWLENNHSSTGGKVWIEYISEGMTSILQVCDIAINKPLKAHVHKAYFDFRLQAIQNLTAKQLTDSVFTVPRENLFEMIENAFELINQQNYRRQWIADAFEKCGQNPWVEGDSKFEAHLASLNENCVYQHMKEGNQTLKLF
uniref:DDE-1 domain-containing protein n=1 Tax=Spongospora subterranea TaxID=70186 RepID=A0A0H5QZX6_9EUKA|eukprot:CRZ07247.1 hypothetical protein [Spongospora subterranea]